MRVSSIISGLACAAAALADLPTIEILGNKFFYSNNGSQFLMKGVAYQQDTAGATGGLKFVDPLADPESCKRDIPFLQELQTNIIRVYALNVSEDHTECMSMLADAGIYVVADLSEPDMSIDRADPEWTVDLYKRYTSVIDLFHNYTNVLGFFAGNEVTNNATNTDASAFVKAAVRDSKAYIKAQGYRQIPVGYSANDDIAIRVPLADYFACGDDDERADFFGINMYEWCGASTFKTSGYQNITDQYQNIGIPIFFSEYGCVAVKPRKFTEVQAIYSDEMTDIWSGGIVYVYFQEANDYGLVSVDGNTVSTLADFNNLKSELASISPNFATIDSASASASVTECPTHDISWSANTALPPTPDDQICGCMSDSLHCVVDNDVDSDDYADLFGVVCGDIDCDGISANGTSGEYGAYSPCSPKDRLNFVLNLYYISNGRSKSACDFSGSASLKSATTASSCSAVLSSAGVSGLGSLSGEVRSTSHANSPKATGTASHNSGSSSGSNSGSNSGSSNSRSSSSTSSDSSSSSSSRSSGASKVVATSFSTGLALVTVLFGVGVLLI